MNKIINTRLTFTCILLFSVLLILFKLLMLLGFLSHSTIIIGFEFSLTSAFILFGLNRGSQLIKYQAKEKRENEYLQKLNDTLIFESKNELFYTGNLALAAKSIIKNIANVVEVDRVSVWTFTPGGEEIVCQQLYLKEIDSFEQGAKLNTNDFVEYFNALHEDSIIVASDAYTHPATKCLAKEYLVPNGIKSMLDVPIWFKGRVYGIICIESKKSRKWIKPEIDFTQILSSLYSFARSVKENNKMMHESNEIEKFIDSANIVTKADAKGKILYVNKKFEEVSGWTLAEIVGKDHKIINSGVHPKSYWQAMYKYTISDRKVWHGIVTNRKKDGGLYFVDSYIKANFDDDGNLMGFTSIRNDLTELVNSVMEIEKKNTYLEHAAKILRHDMHSGINTYIPRGLSSLERRLTPEIIERLKLESPLKMLREGLKHSQKVYSGVFEFTNLVKKDAVLTLAKCNVKDILKDYLSSTAYSSQVILNDNLPTLMLNESLFCTALDNLIRNGLKYNDSPTKFVKIYADSENIYVEDNGRGLSQEDFDHLSRPYTRKEGQLEKGTGLGLNICKAILQEHKFEITCKKLEQGGTQIKIKIKQND